MSRKDLRRSIGLAEKFASREYQLELIRRKLPENSTTIKRFEENLAEALRQVLRDLDAPKYVDQARVVIRARAARQTFIENSLLGRLDTLLDNLIPALEEQERKNGRKQKKTPTNLNKLFKRFDQAASTGSMLETIQCLAGIVTLIIADFRDLDLPPRAGYHLALEEPETSTKH